jgi:hypothetical protein
MRGNAVSVDDLIELLQGYQEIGFGSCAVGFGPIETHRIVASVGSFSDIVRIEELEDLNFSRILSDEEVEALENDECNPFAKLSMCDRMVVFEVSVPM